MLSHSNVAADEPYISALEIGFAALGIALQIVERKQSPGEDLRNKLKGAIEACDVLLVLYTEAASKSPDVLWEIGQADGMKKAIYFIRNFQTKKPIAQERTEDFELKSGGVVVTLKPVIEFFKGAKSNVASAGSRQTAFVESPSKDVNYRLSWEAGIDPRVEPDEISTTAFCAGCEVPLYHNPNDRTGQEYKCTSCGKVAFDYSKERMLKTGALSKFVKSLKK